MKCNSFLLILLLPLSAIGQIMSLDEAIAKALQYNYNILLAKNDSAAAALDYSYKNAAFLPRLNATVGTTWNNSAQRQVLSDGTVRESDGLRSNNLASNIALNWTLFDGLKMFATRDKVEQYVKLGGLTVKDQVINTVATVINTYYNIVQQKQQLRAIEEQISLNEERVKLAQYKLDIGSGAKPDVLQSKVDLNAQKAAQLQEITLIAQLKDQLNQVINPQAARLGQRMSNEYEVSDSIPINTAMVYEEIQNNIENTNLSLLIARKNIDIAGFALKERKAERFPIIAFNGAYNFNRNTNQTVLNSFSTLFNRTRGFNYGFTATIPILNNLNTKRLIQQAELFITNQELVYENQRSIVNLGVLNAFKAYEQQKKALDLEESNILLAKENVNIVLETYRLGAATFIQLREAQQSLEDAYIRLIAARYQTKVAETELLRLKGNIVR